MFTKKSRLRGLIRQYNGLQSQVQDIWILIEKCEFGLNERYGKYFLDIKSKFNSCGFGNDVKNGDVDDQLSLNRAIRKLQKLLLG